MTGKLDSYLKTVVGNSEMFSCNVYNKRTKYVSPEFPARKDGMNHGMIEESS